MNTWPPNKGRITWKQGLMAEAGLHFPVDNKQRGEYNASAQPAFSTASCIYSASQSLAKLCLHPGLFFSALCYTSSLWDPKSRQADNED